MRALRVIILSVFITLCLVKSLQAKEYQLSGKNINILLSNNTKGLLLCFKNNKDNDVIKTNNLFEISFNSGIKLTEKDFNLQAIKQDKETITINYIRNNIKVTTILTLYDQADFARYEIRITAANEPLNMSLVSLMPFKTQAPFVYGSVVSSPIISDSFFIMPENPLTNTTAYEGGVTQKIVQAIPLQPAHTLSYKTYIGTYESGQLRRHVNQFLNVVRARPYHPYLHYNSWLDIGFFNPYTEKQALLRIEQYGEELVNKRGVKLNGYLFDAGWDNLKGNWGFSANFPNEFNKLKLAAEKYHAALGIWLSPWGGYNKPRDIRVSHAAEFGYEIMDGKLALSGANYYANFHKRILALIKQQNITMFKLDGTGNADKVIPGSPFTSDFAAAIHMISDMRKANNKLYINLTTGTQATPSWLFYADSIWRGGDDVNFYGPGTKVQQWLTYRDAETYRSVVMKGPLFPLNSLMLHGIIYAKQAKYLARQSEQDFADQVWSYFASGTQLQELYITPELLSDNNWHVLATAANWARENQAILFDSHWIGSDPTKLAIYGWAAWSNNKSIISLRNPSDKLQVYYLDLQHDLELPAGAPQSYQVSLNYISKNGSKKPAKINKSALVTLAPFETVVMLLAPDNGKKGR
ncbi:enterotoxin [Arsenophonus nasoniae]|uniref:Enterotoxin n=1 Tax=Arsenophonus nasoniae TaxID=638 RepID=A0AA95GH54_9GAMM|nr:enterotoxin [Arsenophonus nasoniae]WGL94436.1 enterotoxin [Arsenophonus nasoniae]